MIYSVSQKLQETFLLSSKFQFDIERARFDEFVKGAEKILVANAEDIDVESVRKSLLQDLTPLESLSKRRERPLPENIDDELARYALSFPQTMDLYEAYVQQPSGFDGIIYQEQILELLEQVFKASPIEANHIRLAIQRGDVEKVNVYKHKFFANLKNITPADAEIAWQHLISNPKAFLKAHAVSHVLELHKYNFDTNRENYDKRN